MARLTATLCALALGVSAVGADNALSSVDPLNALDSNVKQVIELRTDANGDKWLEVQDRHAHWILEHKNERGEPLEAFAASEIEAFSTDMTKAWMALHPGYLEGLNGRVDDTSDVASMDPGKREANVAEVIAYATLHPHHHELSGPVSGWTHSQKAAWNLLHPLQQIRHGRIHDDKNKPGVGENPGVKQDAVLRTEANGDVWLEAQDASYNWILEHKDADGVMLEAFTTREIEEFSHDEVSAWMGLHPGYYTGAATVTALPPAATQLAAMAPAEREALVAKVVAYAKLNPHHHELEGPVSEWSSDQKAAWNLLHPKQQISHGHIHDLRQTPGLQRHETKLAVEPDGSAWYEVQDHTTNMKWYFVHKDASGEQLDAFSSSEIEQFGPLTLAAWRALHPHSYDGILNETESADTVLEELTEARRRMIIAYLVSFAIIHPQHKELTGSPASWTNRQVHSWNILHPDDAIGSDGYSANGYTGFEQDLQYIDLRFGILKQNKLAAAGIFLVMALSVIGIVAAWRTYAAAQNAIRHRGFTSRIGKEDLEPDVERILGADIEMDENAPNGEDGLGAVVEMDEKAAMEAAAREAL